MPKNSWPHRHSKEHDRRAKRQLCHINPRQRRRTVGSRAMANGMTTMYGGSSATSTRMDAEGQLAPSPQQGA